MSGSWQFWLAITAGSFAGACFGISLWPRNRKTFIPYRELNKHRITPRFNVGSDAK